MKLSNIIYAITSLYLVSLSCSKKVTTPKILGSWKTQEIQYQYTDTTYIRNDEDYGRFIFSDKNYALMYSPQMQSRQAFKNLSLPENDEIILAFQSIVFNTGSYSVKDNVITTVVDIAKVPGFENGHQFYEMKLHNNDLELTMFNETYPNGKKPKWYNKLKILFVLKRE